MIQRYLSKVLRLIARTKAIKVLRFKKELVAWKSTFELFFQYEKKSFKKTMPKILIVSSIGENINALALDSILANALESKGCDVYVLMCDGVLDACMNCEIRKFKSLEEFHSEGSNKLCKSCISTGTKFGQAANLKVIKYSDFLVDDLISISHDNESALAGSLRFLAIGDKSSPELRKVLPKFINASALSEKVITTCISRMNIDVVVAHHGIYVPQGLAVKAARQLGKSIVTWSQSYRKGTYLFSHHDSAHKKCSRIGDAFSCDIRCCSVNRFKN
jgi:hypothetical protein